MTTAVSPAAAASPDWEAIELDYRAGIKTLRQIAGEHGITEGAIRKRAKRDGWERDLSEKIQAKAEDLVRKELVRSEVRKDQAITERTIIESNAQAIANVRLAHRKDIRRNRNLVNKLLEALEAQVDEPELFRQLGELLCSPDDKGQDKLNELYHKVIGLPQQIEGAKKLAETLKVLVGMEREAFGMKVEETDGANGLPTGITVNFVRPSA